MLRITYLACDFSEHDKNEHFVFDEDTFQKYIQNPDTQEKIKGKTMLGALSHKIRADFEEYINTHPNASLGSQADFLLDEDRAANAIVGMEIKDHKLYITVETVPYGKGKAVEELMLWGMDLKVSMSTEVEINNGKYYIVNLLGLDHTTAPAFNTRTEAIEKVAPRTEATPAKQFSLNSSLSDLQKSNKKRYYLHYAIKNNSPVEVATPGTGVKQFSLKESVKANSLPPRIFFKKKLDELKSLISSTKRTKLEDDAPVIVATFSEYVYSLVTKLIKDAAVSRINLRILLGHLDILEHVMSLKAFEKVLNVAHNEYVQLGEMSSRTKVELHDAYETFFDELICVIDDKIIPSSKQGVISKIRQ